MATPSESANDAWGCWTGAGKDYLIPLASAVRIVESMVDTFHHDDLNPDLEPRRRLERRGWSLHYHYIGKGLSSSEANFRAALDIAKEHEASLWIAGMADVHKYQTERTKASLSLVKSGDGQLSFRIICLTDPEFYDQPLTLEIKTMAPRSLERVAVKDMDGKAIAVRLSQAGGQTVWRFDVFPRTAEYTIELKP